MKKLSKTRDLQKFLYIVKFKSKTFANIIELVIKITLSFCLIDNIKSIVTIYKKKKDNNEKNIKNNNEFFNM